MNSFYIETYGCTANKADSYIISNLLLNANYDQTTLDKADFIIVNTCAVKEQTENKIKERLKKLNELYGKDTKKNVIIAGCLPHISSEYVDVIKEIVPNFSAIIDLSNIDEIEVSLSEIKKGKKNLVLTSEKSIDKSKFLINHKKGKNTGIVPISEGCVGSCAYCCVKNARGKLNCYNPDNIVRNVEHQLKQEIKQIYLTSQDCSIYQYNETGLVDLVEKIVNLDYKFFLRVGMI
ncbi:MAG TPA: MiaB/RimO family radical SAM methylthiotransferase, partial [Candidatus Lokiarchaeia archaeon]